MILEILSVFILTFPLLIELWDDRHGDVHPNHDVIWRGILMVVCSGLARLINPSHNYFQALSLSVGIFTFFFPYLVNIKLLKNKVIQDKKWWNHLSTTAIPDKWEWWSGTPWFGRMFFMAVILAAGIMTYVCWPCLFVYQGR